MRPARRSDGALGQIRDDQTVSTLWARIEVASSREVYRYAHLEQELTHTLTVRYDLNILQGMFFRYRDGTKDRDFYILAVSDPTERKEWMKCICREGGNL